MKRSKDKTGGRQPVKPRVYSESELDPAFVTMLKKRLVSAASRPDLTETQLAKLLDQQFEK
ncbi:hypothetical protein [Levilactobacillus wangkuiensis]|uniref:hypothetical protein n=1 Tax=Levilactobacillus wangkuiensis TaxID=2799566 RepID=UPI001943961E|nr:hypothetical protein [Levilactobacillus wangkuiensis]